ncbi:MAG TPA: maleylpyruvate isomerase family mycothiol-dependent enzyme [Pseudonocardiaceae bacterium]
MTADLRPELAANRRELADLLAGLPDDSWDAPTLCAGWRVREVVAHLTMPFRYSTGRLLAELARSGLRFDRMSDRCARRDAKVSGARLAAAVRDNITNPWRPPGGGFEGALVHDVIHGLDITVALGIDQPIPPDRLRVVLDGVTKPASRKHFGIDLTGIELRADDLD